ncbi:MAG: filamentous hemagglutinin N-terminal domain-containing protein, partial [Pseudomonas sp.]
MNKHCYRLIFSKKLGFLIPVAEITRTAGKNGQQRNCASPCTNWLIKALPLALLGVLPYTQAQILIAPAQQATVTQSANGVPVLEINNPTNSGLSHNRLSELNVSNPGLILNNSLRDGTSQIGGQVMHNPNLTREARAILAEVTGNTPSSLQGTLEVFGGRADIFIANPNGLTLNGVTTYNASGLAVSTGQVVLGGSGPQFRVNESSGRLLVGPDGVNTQGLSYFDLVARAIELNGQVGSSSNGTDIMAIAGLNTYDPLNRTHRKDADSAANAPRVAIDGTAAGAMHGSYITLVSTESGAGVRHAGLVQSARNIVIDSNGDVTLAQLNAGNDVSVAGKSATLGTGQPGYGLRAGGLLEMKSSGAIVISNDVQVDQFNAVADSLKIQGATLEAIGAKVSGAAKAVNILANDVTLVGDLRVFTEAGQLVPLEQSIVIRDGRVQARLENGRLNPNINLVTSAVLKSGAGIDISAKRLRNDEGIIDDRSTRGIKITADTLDNQGLIQTRGDMALTASTVNNLCFAGGAIGSGFQNICGGLLIGGKGELQIGQLRNEGGLSANDTLALQLGTGAHSNGAYGEISGTRQLSIAQAPGQAASLLNAGRLTTTGNLSVAIDSLENTTGSLLSSGQNLELLIDNALITGATISVGEALNASAKDLRTSATSMITVKQNAAIQASRDLTNENGGLMLFGKDLLMTAGRDMTNSAQIDVKGDNTTITAKGQLRNGEGSIFTTTNLTMSSGGTLTNENSSIISVYNKLLMSSAGNMSNLSGSVITSGNLLNLDVGATLLNDGGALIDGAKANISAQRLVNSGSATLNSSNQLTISTQGDVLNTGGALLHSDELLSVNAGTRFSNDNGLISADDLRLKGITISNSNRGEINTRLLDARAQDSFKSASDASIRGSRLTIDTNRFDATASTILATDDIALKLRDFNNTATVHSKTTASLTMKDGLSLVIGAGQRAPTADALLSIYTHDLTVDGSLSNTGALQIEASGKVLNRGEILSGKWLKAKAAGTIDNQANKLIWAADTITLNAGTTLTNWQNALIRGNTGLNLAADAVINQAGRIEAKNIAIDSALLENRSDVSGDITSTGWVHTDNWYTESWGLWDTEYFHSEFWTPQYSAADLKVKQGVIQASGNLLINQGAKMGSAATVRNLGGLIGAAGDIHIDGNLQNLGSSKSVSLIDYLKNSGAYAQWEVSESTRSDGPELHTNLYDLLDKNLLAPDYTRELVVEYGPPNFLGQPTVSGWFVKFTRADGTLVEKREVSLWEWSVNKDALLPTGQVINGTDKWMNSLKLTATPEASALFSAIFGADWKTLDHNGMRARWEAFKAAPEQSMDFYADKQAELSAGQNFVHTGGALDNGSGANWGPNRNVDVQIGDTNLVTVGGELDALFNRDSAFDVHGKDYLPALKDAINAANVQKDLLDNNPLFTANFQPAEVQTPLDPSAGQPVPGFQGVAPVYTTRVPYDKDAFFGSEYLFGKLGYNPHKTVTVLGDAYFDNELVLRTVEHSLGNFFTSNHQLSGTTLVQHLLDNAATQAGKLGLVIGQPLSQAQYEQLDSDIVWYESQVVNGVSVLAPKVYVSKNTLLARQYQQNSGGQIAAQNVLIDATAVNNINGIIRGNNDTLVYAQGDINNVAKGGADSGIHGGDRGRLTVAAGGNVLLFSSGHFTRMLASRWIDVSPMDGARRHMLGTASLRRQAQALALRPDLKIEMLRGNVDTRLKRQADGDFEAILLATA